jgi:hypothetical protein
VLKPIFTVVDASYGSRTILFIDLKRSTIKQHNSRSDCQDLLVLAEYNAISKGLAEELPFSLFPNTRSSLIKGCKRTSTSTNSFCASLRARCAGAFHKSLHRNEVAARITSRCSGVEGKIREAIEIMRQACAEKFEHVDTPWIELILNQTREMQLVSHVLRRDLN